MITADEARKQYQKSLIDYNKLMEKLIEESIETMICKAVTQTLEKLVTINIADNVFIYQNEEIPCPLIIAHVEKHGFKTKIDSHANESTLTISGWAD